LGGQIDEKLKENKMRHDNTDNLVIFRTLVDRSEEFKDRNFEEKQGNASVFQYFLERMSRPSSGERHPCPEPRESSHPWVPTGREKA